MKKRTRTNGLNLSQRESKHARELMLLRHVAVKFRDFFNNNLDCANTKCTEGLLNLNTLPLDTDLSANMDNFCQLTARIKQLSGRIKQLTRQAQHPDLLKQEIKAINQSIAALSTDINRATTQAHQPKQMDDPGQAKNPETSRRTSRLFKHKRPTQTKKASAAAGPQELEMNAFEPIALT